MEKPTLPKGTRDFGPIQMAKRQFILDHIRTVFQTYGFQPLETPAMENLTTLTGKYGEEGDKLLYRITDSGEIAQKIKDFANSTSNEILAKTSFGLVKILNDIAELIDITKHIDDDQDYIKNITINNSFLDKSDFLSGQIPDSVNSIIKAFLISEDKEHVLHRKIILNILRRKKTELGNPKLYEDELWNDLPLFSVVIQSLISKHAFESITNPRLIGLINEKGLRYDLTVPFARYVVMNRHEITFPFKRYQIQPVWRADRPQKGRYREFYQCDADVVGTDSLICEAEIILMIKEVFTRLGIQDYSIKINHRAILTGLADLCHVKGNESALFVAIDKLDKIGEEKVKEELQSRGFSEPSLNELFEILNFKGATEEKILFASEKFSNVESGKKGINDLKEVLAMLKVFGITEDHVEFDIALARGLSYYTGCIFEVKINNVSIGSVSGGGRYDNLTGVFGMPGVSGVGFSFGVDRLYDAMEELKLFPQEAQISSKVMIAHFDAESKRYGLGILQALRNKGIAAEIYPDSVKIQKQLEYANKKLIPFTVVLGSEEMKSGLLAFKNMKTGEQQKITLDKIIALFKTNNE